MGKEFACTGFMCPMVEGHCVKAAKKEGKRQNISDQMSLSVTKTFVDGTQPSIQKRFVILFWVFVFAWDVSIKHLLEYIEKYHGHLRFTSFL